MPTLYKGNLLISKKHFVKLFIKTVLVGNFKSIPEMPFKDRLHVFHLCSWLI